MGSFKHTQEYQTLSRQIDAINKLPFSRELRNRMIERAKALWHHDGPDQLDGWEAHAFPWERVSVQPREMRH
jgi:hypothetical protein